MPADHVIQTDDAFARGYKPALQGGGDVVEADPNRLVLFGVTPSFPATGYGYIERGKTIDDGSLHVYEVKTSRKAASESGGTVSSRRSILELWYSAGRPRRFLICSRSMSPRFMRD